MARGVAASCDPAYLLAGTCGCGKVATDGVTELALDWRTIEAGGVSRGHGLTAQM